MVEMGGKGAPRYRRKEPVYALWQVLMARADAMEDEAARKRLLECLERKLKQFHVKTRDERHIWLMAATSLVLNRALIEWDPAQEEWASSADGGELVEHLLKERGFMAIDEYAIDQHCSAGRLKRRGREFFLAEGSKVVDEDSEFLVPHWRDAYMSK